MASGYSKNSVQGISLNLALGPRKPRNLDIDFAMISIDLQCLCTDFGMKIIFRSSLDH
nr:3751_t:CDS:2 [Entrophospora candida]